MSDLLLVLVDVDSRLDGGASLVDLLATLIFCSSTCGIRCPSPGHCGSDTRHLNKQFAMQSNAVWEQEQVDKLSVFLPQHQHLIHYGVNDIIQRSANLQV